jgi:membrane-bound serine protease (ClpP class)
MANPNPVRTVIMLAAGILMGATALTVAVGAVFVQNRAPGAETAEVFRVPVSGVIELGLAPFIARSIGDAERAGAAAVILDIDTPGGRIDAAQQIVDAVRDAEVPVWAFINRRAFSAGAMVALAADGIHMRDGAVIGAATPVDGSGTKASEKIVSAMRSEMRALAEEHELDPRIAEAMVDEQIEIDGVVEAGKLLTLTTEEAVALGYAEHVDDWDALLASLDLSGAEVHESRTNWAESLVRFLTNPVVAPLLLSLGVLGIIIEIKTPTFGLAGAAGLTMLALFFGSRYIIGLAGMEEFILLGAGVVLLGVEAFVIPGFGIAGIAGIAAIGSSIFLSLLPSFATAADVSAAAGILSVAGIAVVLIGWALIRHLPGSGRFARSGLLLADSTSRETGYSSASVRAELVGAAGVAVTDLRPAGVVKIGDERIDVVAESEWISSGTPVRVIRADGYRHVVKPAE